MKEFKRSIRRHHRDRMVSKAFNIRYYGWGGFKDWVNSHYAGYKKVIGVNKLEIIEEDKKIYSLISKKIADNLRVCSCSRCSKTYWIKPKNQTTKEDYEDLQE